MQVLVTTDNHVEGSAGLNQHVQDVVEGALGYLSDRITRVEVHLMDQSGATKGGDRDKRCAMEARIGGRQPISVMHDADTVDEAIAGALDKLEKTLERTLDKLEDRKGRTSMGGEQTI